MTSVLYATIVFHRGYVQHHFHKVVAAPGVDSIMLRIFALPYKPLYTAVGSHGL